MEFPRETKKLFPFKFPLEDELRLSVKQGLEKRFSIAVNKLNANNMKEIVNKKYLIEDNQEMTLLIEATINGRLRCVVKLLKNCIDKIDLDAVGKVNCFGSLVDGATALWCAAGFGHFKIVKKLIESGANVDSCTETKSTPLRAACYLGRVDIVNYLIAHGANVNVTNVFDSTCLMIASYNGHVDVVKCLLANKADVNKQTLCGATAMHFAAQANNLDIIQFLLDSNAQQLKNEHSMTPILVASERTHFMLVSVLRDILPLTLEEIIDAEELLGASYLNDRDNYNKEAGYYALLRAMHLRFKRHPFCFKKPYKKVEAYNNRIECQSIKDLVNIKDDDDALHYESLIIRERILGENNPDLLQSIIYRGAIYADLHNYYPCVKLWIRALKISELNKISVSTDIKRFTQVFCQMIKRNIKINLSDLKTVLQVVTEDIKVNQVKLALIDESMSEHEKRKEEYFENVHSTLGLIIITSITFAKDKDSKDPLIKDIMQIIVELNKLKVRTKTEQTLLHLCLNYDTNVDNIFTTGICCFPNYLSMKLLIYCGADVNAMDIDQSTPLHYIGKFIIDFPHIPHASEYLDTKKMVMELINAGAHTDYVNKYGFCPHTGYLNTIFKITSNMPLSLKCLSARTLKHKCQKKYYYNEIPQTLKDFVNFH